MTKQNVLAICTAYESGYGHGQEIRGLANPYMDGSDEFDAYAFGYRSGMLKRRADEPSAPLPHPNGRCKCAYCHEGFVTWGDCNVHERSCAKRLSVNREGNA